MKAEDVRIGQRIRYTQRFNAKAGDRFTTYSGTDWPRTKYKLRPEFGGGGEAFVTGLSWRAMSDWTVGEVTDYFIADGTRELVMLCRKRIKGAEFVVQLADAELLEEGSYD